MRLYSFFVTFLDVNFFSFKFEMYYSFISPSCHSFLTFWNAVYTFERQEKLSLRRETFSLYLPYLSTFLMFSFFFFLHDSSVNLFVLSSVLSFSFLLCLIWYHTHPLTFQFVTVFFISKVLFGLFQTHHVNFYCFLFLADILKLIFHLFK